MGREVEYEQSQLVELRNLKSPLKDGAWPDYVTYCGNSLYEAYARTSGWVDQLSYLIKQDTLINEVYEIFLGYVPDSARNKRDDYFLMGFDCVVQSYEPIWCSCVFKFRANWDRLNIFRLKRVNNAIGMFKDRGCCLDYIKQEHPRYIKIR